jgi:RNA polymerase sigma-70 factor (sigma-E family)
MDTMTRPVSFEEYGATAWPALYRAAYLLTGNHADAEDIAQQTLIKAHGAWDRVRNADSPQAYLRRTLTNTFLSDRRPAKRRLEVLRDEVPEPAAQAPAGIEDRLAIWPHIRALAPRQRAVIVLRYYEQLSEAEIAETLGCSRGTVKSTAHDALRNLREAMATTESGRED